MRAWIRGMRRFLTFGQIPSKERFEYRCQGSTCRKFPTSEEKYERCHHSLQTQTSVGESNLQDHRQDQWPFGGLLKQKSAQIGTNLFLDNGPVRSLLYAGLLDGSEHSGS